jgi:hypothetical protein
MDLEVDEDPEFQRRTWKVQRVGWIAMLLIIVAAGLGLFGGGPLSWTKAAAGTLQLEYERFIRYDSIATLHIKLSPAAVKDGYAKISLDARYFSGTQINNVWPEPEAQEVTADGYIFMFRIADPHKPAHITFYFKMLQVGPLTGHVSLDAGPSVAFHQFVYP